MKRRRSKRQQATSLALPIRKLVGGTIVALLLAGFASSYSLAVVYDTSQPQIANSAYGGLPKAKARLADLRIARATEELVRANPDMNAPRRNLAGSLASAFTADTRSEVEALALAGLRLTAYNAEALRQLATVEPDQTRRLQLLRLSRSVTRRDVSAAVQLAELQIIDGELRSGLDTLDQALVVSSSFDQTLFPILLSITRDAEAARLLREVFSDDPVWSERLARFAVTDGAAAVAFANIVDAFPTDSRARSIDYGTQLIDRLTADRNYSAAFAAYRAYSDADVDYGAFGTGSLPPLDWRLVDDLDTGSRVLQSEGPITEIFANAGQEGDIARIVTAFPAGSYTLSMKLRDLRGADGRLELARICLIDGQELATQSVGTALDAESIELSFDVPGGCPMQSLRLRASTRNASVSALASDVAITRSGARQANRTPSTAAPVE